MTSLRPPGAGAPVCAPAPLASRYAALRSEFNAALTALYERTALPVADIAREAGVTDRDIYALVYRLGCVPRRPQMRGRRRLPGSSREPPPRLDTDGAALALTAFRDVVLRLREEAEARKTEALLRQSEAAARREERAARLRSSAELRRLQRVASALHAMSTLGRVGAKRQAKPAAGKPVRRASGYRPMLVAPLPPVAAKPPATPVTPPDPPTAALPVDDERARRINEIAERYYAREREGGPRIRKLW